MNKWIIVGIAAVAIVGVFALSGAFGPMGKTSQTPPTPINQEEQNGVKTFNLTGAPFEFSMKEIKVRQGDRVRINFTTAQGFHDWTIDEFNAKTKQLQAGQSDSIEFTADKKGEFEYYCSVGNHRQMGMVGKLIVE